MARSDDRRSIRCSFCNKPQSMVTRLVAGNDCYICDECVRMCAQIVGLEPEVPSYDGLPMAFEKLPKPREIKENLDKLAGKVVLDCHNILTSKSAFHL